ncbi:hypothetical protein GQ600_24072 [Phytophthora cactorum]|nr:hypothetical protein GQ600_24072 [Phytophthora cactorum]
MFKAALGPCTNFSDSEVWLFHDAILVLTSRAILLRTFFIGSEPPTRPGRHFKCFVDWYSWYMYHRLKREITCVTIMSDEHNPNAFDASLSFVEEYVAETFSSAEIPALASSPATFSSSTSRFSDATPSDFCEPVADPTAKLAETLAMVPLPIADQGNYAAYVGLKESQSTTKKRISAKPRKPQANPNRVRNELRFELAFLREKAAQLEQELSSLQQKLQTNSTALAARERTPTVILVPHGDSTQEVEAWKGIAGRQRKRRESAQRENSRLRIIVEKQRKIAVDLTALLRKRVREHTTIIDFTGDTFNLSDSRAILIQRYCSRLVLLLLYDFTKELYSNNSRADMKAKQIVRRYIETEREIVVFVSRVSPIEIRHKAIEGMAYHLRGYVVTKPSPVSAPGHELTMLQFCSRISIDEQPGVIYDREHVRAVIRFLIASSLAFRLSDALPPEFLGGGGASTAETSMVLSLAMAEQLASATGTGYQIGTSLVSKPQQSKLRKANRPRKPLSNPNRVRNELRFELAYLRETVSQLEQELSSLQLDTEENMLCDGRARQEGDAVTTQDPSVKENRFTRVLDYHGDLAEFQELFPILEDTYHGLDTVLEETGLATMDIPTEDVHIREGVGGKYVEFFANKVLPFGLSDTTEAAWDHFKGIDKHCGNGELYEKAAMVRFTDKECSRSTVAHCRLLMPSQNLDQPFTIIEDFTKEVYSNSSRADMEMKQIVRRFVEPDRDVIIFVCRGKPIEIKHKAIAGLTYHLRSYVVANELQLRLQITTCRCCSFARGSQLTKSTAWRMTLFMFGR